MTVTQDSNAGERDDSPQKMEPEAPRQLTPKEIAAAREAQEIADGHRYRTQEFNDAREAEKPGSDRKKAREEAKKAGPKKGPQKNNPKDMPPKATERIAKVLARAGLASRREVERLIGLGKIAVNGRILETPAVLVSSADVITVDGQPIGKADATRLWRYHKPVGLITTHSDPQGRPTLFEKLPQDLPRVISVGRLDLNSEGLLLLTNDGELARALEKPSSGWVRRYRVRALGNTTQHRLDTLKNGTTVEGVIYGPMEATLDKVAEKADGRANVWLTVAITEGKNREVRKVLESIGLKVNRLIRLAYGPFLLGDLDSGEVEEVGPRVIRELLADIVPLKNLPPEGASQTQGAPRAPRSDEGRGAPQGRRGGGDRFGAAKDRPSFDRARPERAFGDKPRGKPAFAEKRDYKERDFDQRPRFEGDGESRDRKPPRDGDFASPTYAKKPYAQKPYASRDSDPRAGYTPRPDRAGQGERSDRAPSRPYDAKKPYGAKKSYGAPAGEAGAYERAKREFGGKTEGDKPAFKKPYPPRDRPEGGARPFNKPFRSDRPSDGGDARSSYTPRPDRDGAASGGYKKPYDKKPYAARDGDSGAAGGYKKPYDKKPYAARDGESSGGFKKPYGARPTGDRPSGDRPAFNKGPRPGGAPRPGGKPGPRPNGPRPGGPRPGGPRPGGSGTFNRKPRDS